MKHLYYTTVYRQFFLNTEGIKLFAERCINYYVSKGAVTKANLLTSYVKILKEERSMRREEFITCSKSDRMDDGSFAMKRKRSKSMMVAVYFAIVFEIFLNYVSTLIFIQGDGLLFILVRWGLSIILAIAGMLVTDALLSRSLPDEAVRIKGSDSKFEDDVFHSKREKSKRVISLIILPFLLIAIEWAIVGVSEARALDIEGGRAGGILYYGLILLSMALPVIAGYFKWESEQHGKIYQNTLNYHKTSKLIHILDLSIVATMKDVKDVVEYSTMKAWQVFARFKLYKENYNAKHNVTKEICELHYCKNASTFAEEAISRFGDDVFLILKELKLNQK